MMSKASRDLNLIMLITSLPTTLMCSPS